jgi:hypothetical protein
MATALVSVNYELLSPTFLGGFLTPKSKGRNLAARPALHFLASQLQCLRQFYQREPA